MNLDKKKLFKCNKDKSCFQNYIFRFSSEISTVYSRREGAGTLQEKDLITLTSSTSIY